MTTKSDIETNKAIVRRLYAAVQAGDDLSFLADFVADNIRDHSPNFQDAQSPLANFRAHLASLSQVFENLAIEIEHLFAEGDTVIVYWRLEGHHKAELWGVPATGRSVVTGTVSRLRFAEGRLIEYESRPDRLDLLSQLGALGFFAGPFKDGWSGSLR